MIRTSGLFFLLSLMCIIYFGCAKAAPGCNAEKTKQSIFKIFKDKKLKQMFNLRELQRTGSTPSEKSWNDTVSKLKIGLESIRTTNVDSKTGKCECAADLTIELEGEKTNLAITYISELVEDKKDTFRVQIFGL